MMADEDRRVNDPTPHLQESAATPHRALRLGRRALLVLVSLTPLWICLSSGAMTSSLWMDEISYFQYESDPAPRASELGRPGSAVTPLLSTFAYCEFQRLFRRGIGLLPGVTRSGPEIPLRALPMTSFLLLVILTWIAGFRSRRSEVQATLGALVVSSTPILLHYAFEARPYAFSACLAAAYVASVGPALRRGGRWTVLAVGLGFILQRVNWWAVCIPLALALWGVWDAIRRRSLSPRQLRLAAIVAPGGILAVAEWQYLVWTTPPNPPPTFPLFVPQGLWIGLLSTVQRTFSPSV